MERPDSVNLIVDNAYDQKKYFSWKEHVSFELGLPGDAPQDNRPNHQPAAAQQPAAYDAIRGSVRNGDCCWSRGGSGLCCDCALASPDEPPSRLWILQEVSKEKREKMKRKNNSESDFNFLINTNLECVNK